MSGTYMKLLLRGVKKTYARFLSILAIVAIGVGFLTGLMSSTPDMKLTSDKYYDDFNLYDIDIKGTAGITDEDIDSVKNLSWVENAMPAYVTDLNMKYEDSSYVTRLYGMPMNSYGTSDFINSFELVSGRMPENKSECVIEIPNGYTAKHDLGEVYTISEDNKNYDTIGDTYSVNQLTVVGIVQSPYYMSTLGEPSTVGSGQVELIMYMFSDCYSLDVYTDLFLTVNGAKKLDTYSDEYDNLIEDVEADIESLGEKRSQARYDDIVTEANEKLEEARAEYQSGKEEAESELADAKKSLDDGYAQIENAKNELKENEEKVAAGEQQIANAKSELAANIDAQKAQLELTHASMSEEQYQAALAQINQAQNDGLAQIAEKENALKEARAQISNGQKEIEENQKKLDDSQTAYNEAKQESDEKLAQAETDIEEAQNDVNSIEVPEWYISDRSDNVSYVNYKDNAEKVAAIAKVFPVFFFLVAALVSLTTMTRMVEEERTQIGTLKALGYSRGAIIFYYIGYSIAASLIGGIIGVALGSKILPAVIANAYTMMFDIIPTITKIWWEYAVIIIPVAVACITLSTLFACTSQLNEKPSHLMLPRVPKAGKRIFIEYIGFIWKKMSFTKKVTARNIFRYKKRFFMTVIGIAGCTALLVAGLGLRDSISDIAVKQFGQIYKYNMSINLKEENTDEAIDSVLNDKKYVNSYAYVHTESGHAENGSQSETVTILAPKEIDELKQQVNLRERLSGKDIAFNEDSVVITEKLSELVGAAVGDKITVKNFDGKTAEFTVTGIMENYINNYVYISNSAYSGAYGETPEYKMILADLTDDSQQARDEISNLILKSDNIALLQYTKTIGDTFQDSMGSIDYIVLVLIVSAGALAVIVVYNLTNINICERKKELATIKVLGFHRKEVAWYIYRETTILAVIGILVGFLLGKALHIFVIKTAEMDTIMFGRGVSLQSYIIAAAITLFFTFLVDIIMLKKLKDINMVESMKANE
jgi:putative ABC transport system permease protein